MGGESERKGVNSVFPSLRRRRVCLSAKGSLAYGGHPNKTLGTGERTPSTKKAWLDGDESGKWARETGNDRHSIPKNIRVGEVGGRERKSCKRGQSIKKMKGCNRTA